MKTIIKHKLAVSRNEINVMLKGRNYSELIKFPLCRNRRNKYFIKLRKMVDSSDKNVVDAELFMEEIVYLYHFHVEMVNLTPKLSWKLNRKMIQSSFNSDWFIKQCNKQFNEKLLYRKIPIEKEYYEITEQTYKVLTDVELQQIKFYEKKAIFMLESFTIYQTDGNETPNIDQLYALLSVLTLMPLDDDEHRNIKRGIFILLMKNILKTKGGEIVISKNEVLFDPLLMSVISSDGKIYSPYNGWREILFFHPSHALEIEPDLTEEDFLLDSMPASYYRVEKLGESSYLKISYNSNATWVVPE